MLLLQHQVSAPAQPRDREMPLPAYHGLVAGYDWLQVSRCCSITCYLHHAATQLNIPKL